MPHLLDNMIWHALITGNRNIAELDGKVGLYKEDIAPFAGMEAFTEDNLATLHQLLSPKQSVAVSYTDAITLDSTQWEIVQHMDCCQMVYTNPIPTFTTPQSHLIQPLTDMHIPQMLELTALTKPGPFRERTILFGNYFGIFIDGRLAAMAGQRMHPVPYLEVSAVCTHPDFRGHGYAKAAMLKVMELILQQSFIPFLHVLSNNTAAIALYESIGFTVRRNLFIDVIRKQFYKEH
jgi:predicted GNAT family acetyltransferase